MEVKYCSKCTQTKETTFFYKNNSKKDRFSSYCKECNNKRTTEYVKNNTERLKPFRKKYALLYRYNIFVEEYENLLLKQNNQCAICLTSVCSTGRSLAVDHCHTTGKVRGLLCSDCNTGLGHFKDKVNLLDKAKEYLNANH